MTWAAWRGLFGIASNELNLIVRAIPSAQLSDSLPDGVEVLSECVLEATARPQTEAPCERDGLYVLRRFVVDAADIDTVVELSSEAWITFEGTSDYEAQPMGLFAGLADRDNRAQMMLVTWYDGFSSWEASRTPSPQARQHFRKRRALTHSTGAVALSLVSL